MTVLIAVAGTITALVLSGKLAPIISSVRHPTSNNPTKEKQSSEDLKAKQNNLFKSITNRFDKKIGPALQKAQQYLDQRSTEKAASEFAFLADKYKSSPRARYGKAQALEQKAEKERSNQLMLQAAETYGEVAYIENCPDELKKLALRTMSDKLTFLGRYSDANRALERLVNIFPEDCEVYNDLGIQLLVGNKNKKALGVFQKVRFIAQMLITRADFVTITEIDTLISKLLSVENKAKLYQLETQNTSSAVVENKAKLSQLTRSDFVTIIEIDTLISKRFSIENKAKPSQLETQNTCLFTTSS